MLFVGGGGGGGGVDSYLLMFLGCSGGRREVAVAFGDGNGGRQGAIVCVIGEGGSRVLMCAIWKPIKTVIHF